MVVKSSTRLYASAKAVIMLYLSLPGSNRINNIIERVGRLPEEEVDILLEKVMNDFASRHRNIGATFIHHFNRANNQRTTPLLPITGNRQLLLGAFFTKEYSIQSAALFNPSIVAHPDQQGLQPGHLRFVMSLRATGEGHISSIVFKTGVIDNHGGILLDDDPGCYTALNKDDQYRYEKKFVLQRAAALPGFDIALAGILPEMFTGEEAVSRLHDQASALSTSVRYIEEILDSNYTLQPSLNIPLVEKVLFPHARAECMGMEDVRFVRFEDAGISTYYGTYTAYDGSSIRTQLVETTDFDTFKIRTLYGNAVSDKGMALFPEKINGKYVMISRQGGEVISIMFSEDLYVWENYDLLMEPFHPWEMVQLGNCGSPVKTDKGWLLLTHGVGAMRTYVISAVLLDLENPSIVVARLNRPLIQADESEREGYVPNVVYTCGLLRHHDLLIIPYAMSDSATAFATINVHELLSEMTLIPQS